METLGRFPLTVILSYLSETEGTSLLITRKLYATQILPLFQIKISPFDDLSVLVGGRSTRAPKCRHRFVVSPVQDPTVLLERLNTRNLYKRRCRPVPGKTTAELTIQEWEAATTRGDDGQHAAALSLLRFSSSRPDNLRQHNGTLLVSYPRSGNTLMRTLLERVTGIVTGSDTRPDRSLSKELAEKHGMVGEGITQASKVVFVKTHWPERTGNQVYEGKRAILLVRNPYDAIDSYWNLNATKSHTRTVTDEVYTRFADKFDRLVRNEIEIWLRFHDYWLEECSIPVLVVRFEDLIQDPAAQLRRALKFSFNETASLSPFWERRIQYVTRGSSSERLGSYRPRSSQSKVLFKSLSKGRYSDEQLSYIDERSAAFHQNYVEKFGYKRTADGFPSKLSALRLEKYEPSVSSPIAVNRGRPVRPLDCEFGRWMQQWRHSITDNDRNPLPTVSR